jgi:hypothetical protein
MGAKPTAAGRKNNFQGGCIYPPSKYKEIIQQLQYQYEKFQISFPETGKAHVRPRTPHLCMRKVQLM